MTARPQPKPVHLEPAYAAQFADESVVRAYSHRPPYPLQTFDLLLAMPGAERGRVLDVGCGTGDLARPLAARGARVDAVDRSAPMLSRGRLLPDGDADALRWIEGEVETASLDGPYALVTAAESLHWMDWSVVLPRLERLLAPGGRLVLIGRDVDLTPWDDGLFEIIPRYSTNRDYAPYDLVQELTSRGLFASIGETRTEPLPFVQSVEAYIESFHSRNGFSRDRMPTEDAAAFDAEVRALVTPLAVDGRVHQSVRARLVWGLPRGGEAAGGPCART